MLGSLETPSFPTLPSPARLPLDLDLRSFLQRELARRCAANPRYSLRAFARLLGIENSHLSKLLRQERPIGAKLRERLIEKLGVPPEQAEVFRRKASGEPALDPALPEFQQLSTDIFCVAESSAHYALLELMKVKGFVPDHAWIARRLRLSQFEVAEIVERLERTGLLRREANGAWTDTSRGFSTDIIGASCATVAHRNAQRRILEDAIRALEETPIEQRDQSSMMMATSRRRIAEAKERIRKFRRELCAFLENAPEKDAVFQLSVSLFPVAGSDEPE